MNRHSRPAGKRRGRKRGAAAKSYDPLAYPFGNDLVNDNWDAAEFGTNDPRAFAVLRGLSWMARSAKSLKELSPEGWKRLWKADKRLHGAMTLSSRRWRQIEVLLALQRQNVCLVLDALLEALTARSGKPFRDIANIIDHTPSNERLTVAADPVALALMMAKVTGDYPSRPPTQAELLDLIAEWTPRKVDGKTAGRIADKIGAPRVRTPGRPK